MKLGAIVIATALATTNCFTPAGPVIGKKTTSVGFSDWITDAPNEVTEWTELHVQGKIPSFLQGTLVRNGPGIWDVGGERKYSHVFDGLAKLSTYRFEYGKVLYQNRFVKSSLYNKTMASGDILPTIAAGPVLEKSTNEPIPSTILNTMQAVANTASSDNTCVNVWNYAPHEQGTCISTLTDSPARCIISVETIETESALATAPSPLKGIPFLHEVAETTHPLYSLSSGDSYNIATCVTLNGPVVALVRESADGTRKVVGTENIPDTIPYLHSFGLTDKHAVVIIPPLRPDLGNLDNIIQQGFLSAMQPVEETRVIVLELDTGKCVLHKTTKEPVYYYHTISTASVDSDTVSIRLCGYKTAEMVSGSDDIMTLDLFQGGREARNRIHKAGVFCDVVCDLQQDSVEIQWKDMEQGFEMPVTRFSRAHGPNMEHVSKAHPRYVYAFGSYALGSPDHDDWALLKLEPESENVIAAYYQGDSRFFSEPIFVADPNGKDEDDGVILSQMYDGEEGETILAVLNAKNMEILAEIWTNNRSPMDFHGGWFPAHTFSS